MILKKKKISNENNQINLFLGKDYQMHNIARIKHLDTLSIEFKNKSVLELGAGIGDHTLYLLIKGAKVLATDGRPELVDFLSKRFDVSTEKIDAEKDLEKILKLPKFDIVYCYGLLYHICNPEEFLNTLKDKTDLLLLETCVSSDHLEDGPYIVNENQNEFTQALSGSGCRPTRNWIFSNLKHNFKYVYTPITQPEHSEFPKDWNQNYDNSKSNLIRAIFIASNEALVNDNLQDILPKIYL